MVFEHEPDFMNTTRKIGRDLIEEAQMKYDTLAEEFLDEVFEDESKLSRKDWEIAVSKKQNYLFDP